MRYKAKLIYTCILYMNIFFYILIKMTGVDYLTATKIFNPSKYCTFPSNVSIAFMKQKKKISMLRNYEGK